MRKYIYLLIAIQGLTLTAFSQYWQQQTNYTIDVSLNDKEHTLTGFEKIEYINNSPDTLKFIWFHLWPNAYKNDKTAFSDQLLENGSTKFYFSGKEDKGYINRLNFKVNNVTAATEDHPQHIDIVKIILPTPLPPGQKINITTPFHVKLPYNFSRGGHDGQSYQITQWYPKPAVYDAAGWHPMPYLDQGEFYSEFGSFDVSITLPKNYVVAATGDLQNAAEKEWLAGRVNYNWEPIKQQIKNISGQLKTSYKLYPESEAVSKTLQYKQNNIHNFAWFADKRFIVNSDTCKLSSGKVIDVYTFYTPQEKDTWKNSVAFGKDAVRHYSEMVGEYPYNIVQAVQGPKSFGGGMEYPTITVISPTNSSLALDNVMAHEIGHNWFYGILGSNERKHPWMDEGINSYYDNKYQLKKNKRHSTRTQQNILETFVAQKKDQPIATTSEQFTTANYGLVAYYKTSQWMQWMEDYLGTATFNKAMQEYYRQWQFKHPHPEDLKKVMESVSGKNLDSAFALLTQKGNLPNINKKGIGIQSPMGFVNGKLDAKKTAITISPVIGANSYDKIMLGAAITNLRMPPNKFQFLAIPMYATGSKKLNGIGFANLNLFPKNIFQKIDIGISGSFFTADQFTDEEGSKNFLGFGKIVPGIRFTLKQNSERSSIYRYIQFKSFLINEDGRRFFQDTVIVGLDTTISNKTRIVNEKRTLNQLKFVIENNRVLYPYRGELKIEQGKGFYRLAFTGNYFFNYSKNRGGVDVRFFAGKFIYSDKKTANSFLYGLTLSAPKGNLDYTYSDYFIGRNDYPFRSEGYTWTIPYQQIMIRDGGLKVNTDGQGNIGFSDDWVTAINANFDIPESLNPLQILPIKIPLKIFVDIGTYSEAWKKEATGDHFLYDAGLQLSFLKNSVNIYIPLLYSRVFKEYYKADFFSEGKNRFLKTISFSIDISNFSFRKIDRNLNF